MFISTNKTAAPNKLIETMWSSAISFMKVVGNNKTAIPIAYVALSVNKPVLLSSNQVVETKARAVVLQTLMKITIRKKLLMKMAKQIT